MYHIVITDSNNDELYGEIDFTETGIDDFMIMRNSVLAEMLLDDEDVNDYTFFSEGRGKIETL